jgi:hypothetical protein
VELVVAKLGGLEERAPLQRDHMKACGSEFLDHHATAGSCTDHTDIELLTLAHAG